MKNTCHLLAFSADASFRPEIEAAAAAISRLDVVVRFVGDERLAIEHAGNRRVDAICAETDDIALLRRFAEAAAAQESEPVLVVAYRAGDPRLDGRGAFFIEATRAGVRDFITRPISSDDLAQALQRNTTLSGRQVRRTGRVLSFVSNKGGVGKSTLAVNTACALAARHRDDVLLIDASLQMGVCASMLDLTPETSLVDAANEAVRLDESLLRRLSVPHRCGLRLLAAPKDAVEAAQVDDAVLSRVLSLARREFAFVVVDTFPVLDSVAMAIVDLSDMVYVVTTRALPNATGVRTLLTVLERVGLPRSRQRILLNDSHPAFAGKLAPADIARHLDRDIEAVFPFDKRVLVAYDSGQPVSANASRWFGFAKAMAHFVADIPGPTAAGGPRASADDDAQGEVAS